MNDTAETPVQPQPGNSQESNKAALARLMRWLAGTLTVLSLLYVPITVETNPLIPESYCFWWQTPAALKAMTGEGISLYAIMTYKAPEKKAPVKEAQPTFKPPMTSDEVFDRLRNSTRTLPPETTAMINALSAGLEGFTISLAHESISIDFTRIILQLAGIWIAVFVLSRTYLSGASTGSESGSFDAGAIGRRAVSLGTTAAQTIQAHAPAGIEKASHALAAAEGVALKAGTQAMQAIREHGPGVAEKVMQGAQHAGAAAATGLKAAGSGAVKTGEALGDPRIKRLIYTLGAIALLAVLLALSYPVLSSYSHRLAARIDEGTSAQTTPAPSTKATPNSAVATTPHPAPAPSPPAPRTLEGTAQLAGETNLLRLSSSPETLRLFGIGEVARDEARQAANDYLSKIGTVRCTQVTANDNAWICLAPQRSNADIAVVFAYSGLANATSQSPPAIREAEKSAKARKAGIWRY